MRLKKDSGAKCHRGSAADRAVNRSEHDLKSDAENQPKTVHCCDTDAKFSQAADADPPELKLEPVSSERMWEDISDVSETSGISGSYSDVSALPASTRVTVVGNGLIQVSPADPLMRRLSLESDDTKMSMGLSWKTGSEHNKQRCLWNTYSEVTEFIHHSSTATIHIHSNSGRLTEKKNHRSWPPMLIIKNNH